MPADRMSRHTLILGETGSGKTKSGIFPLVEAALRYTRSPAMLIIDPKNEIRAHAERILAESTDRRDRLRTLQPGVTEFVIDAFEGWERPRLSANAIVDRLDAMLDTRPPAKDDGNSRFFNDRSRNTIRGLLAVDCFMFRTAGEPGLERFWLTVKDAIRGAGTQMADTIPLEDANYFSRHLALLVLASSLSRDGTNNIVVEAYLRACEHLGVPVADRFPLLGFASLARDTFVSVVGTICNTLELWADPDLVRHVWLHPFVPTPTGVLSVAGVMAEGTVLCYRPDDFSDVDTRIGKVLKSKFFELTFRRADRERAVMYVCDEFQRFITSDPLSGEQSYLDRCRAFRGICVLASQSLSSLRYALASDGVSELDKYSLEVLLNNTGNKLYFRNTDIDTQSALKSLLPIAPHGGPHVLEMRPVTTLATGECYYMLTTGQWGRARVMMEDVSARAGVV